MLIVNLNTNLVYNLSGLFIFHKKVINTFPVTCYNITTTKCNYFREIRNVWICNHM